jgi:hypothetical protein
MNEKRRHWISVWFVVIPTAAFSAYMLSVLHKLVAAMVSGH